MAGLYMKIFLFRVMGERPNSGHPWLSATLSFVITHLQVLVEECVCLSECGLTPVGNRVSRLILPLPTPVGRVNRARWEAQISSGVMHQQSPHCMDGPHAFYSSETCKWLTCEWATARASGADISCLSKVTCNTGYVLNRDGILSTQDRQDHYQLNAHRFCHSVLQGTYSESTVGTLFVCFCLSF